MEFAAKKAVDELLPRVRYTPVAFQMATRLRLFLDIKDADYHVMQSLFVLKDFDKLKEEEAFLKGEFNYSSILKARASFRQLVLTSMKVEAKSLGVDLKPLYLEEAEFYNSAVPENDNGLSPIRKEDATPARSTINVDYLFHDDEEKEEDKDENLETFLTTHQLRYLISKRIKKEIDGVTSLISDVEKRLDLRFGQLEDKLIKSVDDVLSTLKTTDERLSKKVSEVTSNAVEAAKELAEAAVSKEIRNFTQVHLKDHVKPFLGTLLKDEDVASNYDLRFTNRLVKEVEDKMSALQSLISTSASAANQRETAVSGDISALYSSRETLTSQVEALQAEVKNLTGVITALSDDVKKGEGEKEKKAEKKQKKKEKKKSREGSTTERPSPSPEIADQIDRGVSDQQGGSSSGTAEQARLITEAVLMGANADHAVDPNVQRRIQAEKKAERLRLDADKADALRKMKEEEKRASLAQAEVDRVKRQKQANLIQLNKKYLKRKAQAAMEGKDWLGPDLQPQWDELISSFILLQYWIKLPPYDQENHGEAFNLFIRHFGDRALVKRVVKLASEASIGLPVPAKETFFRPLLSDGKTVDYTAINEGVRSSALNFDIPPSDPRFKQIEDGIYASMGLLPRREESQSAAGSSK